MRSVLPIVLAGLLLVGPGASPASAVSVRDLVMLHQAGLSDDLLIELMASDGSVYRLTAEQIVELRRQGLSERVIIAMLRTGRETVPQAAAARPGLAPGVFEPAVAPPPPVYIHVTQPPVVVNVTHEVEQRVETERVRSVFVPVAVPVKTRSRRDVSDDDSDRRSSAPSRQYWGWGGERRPDSWGSTRRTPDRSREKN